ncbi:MAG: hypothetical protein NUW01_16340 [Gemmatimonadaceae bacterium]|nr:hypothetical protein [Gemmatimonadaceae bacterium]
MLIQNCGRSAFLGILLVSTAGCGGKAQTTAEQVGRNFLEEMIAEAGIRPRSEGLGLAGSASLRIPNDLASSYSRFVEELASSLQLRVLPAQVIVSDSVYQELLALQTSNTRSLFRVLGEHVLTPSKTKNGHIDPGGSPVIAVITFAAYNGDAGLAFGTQGLRLLAVTGARIASLAASLKADYMAAVTVVRHVESFDPMGKLGTVSASYRIQVFDRNGNVIVDEPVVGDPSQPRSLIRFTGFDLAFFLPGKNGLRESVIRVPHGRSGATARGDRATLNVRSAH